MAHLLKFITGKLGHWGSIIVFFCLSAPILIRRCPAYEASNTPRSLAFIFFGFFCWVFTGRAEGALRVLNWVQCGVCAMSALSLDVHVKLIASLPPAAAPPSTSSAAPEAAAATAAGFGAQFFAVGKSAHENYKFRFSLASAGAFIIFSLISLPLHSREFAILTKVFRARKASKSKKQKKSYNNKRKDNK